MPLSIEALYGKEKIGIVKALEIRNAAKSGKGTAHSRINLKKYLI
jgi:hypothetical protein